jgi:hypothetical protein
MFTKSLSSSLEFCSELVEIQFYSTVIPNLVHVNEQCKEVKTQQVVICNNVVN